MSAEIKPKYQLVHDGPYQQRVDQLQCNIAMASTRNSEIPKNLLSIISDQANLAVAFDSLAAQIKAPGRDGKTKDDYAGPAKWELIRQLEQSLRQFNGTNSLILDEKLVRIPKSQGKYRELTLLNFSDRVVNKALEQILSPLWDRYFLPTSFGSDVG